MSTQFYQFSKPINRLHFIGIGGIGVSALARLARAASGRPATAASTANLFAENIKISGSDIAESELINELKNEDVDIKIGHRSDNVPNEADLVVYTTAISEDNPEFLEARRRNIPTMSRPEFLGFISQNYQTIAVAGTHGKPQLQA